ncbi:hypothetical protein PVAG01_00150 [Phlyctema vagabunda]|uniref:Alternative oxidase n=1 Tax=Phlyctema vagabunda TaxID=108571 RepID=A0ABR4PTR2_9HELO
MGLSGVPRASPVKLGIILLSILSLLYFISHPSDTSKHHRLNTIYSSANDFYDQITIGKKASFINDILENDIDGTIDYDAIKFVCNSKKWTDGLVIECKAPEAGIATVRNVYLNCVRYAIEAGGGFILPEVMTRGQILNDNFPRKQIPMAYLFDTDHFITSMTRSCPQMHIYSSLGDLWDKPSAGVDHSLNPQDIAGELKHGSILAKPEEWRAKFDKYLNGTTEYKVSSELPVRIALSTPHLQFPLSYDKAEFVANLGRVFRFRHDVRRLAATVLYALNEKYKLNIDPEAGIEAEKYYGGHVQPIDEGWTSYDDQTKNYVAAASEQKLKVLYLATGSETTLDKFNLKATEYNLTTETKTTLLAGPEYAAERSEMGLLTWDQQALIDYEILLRSSRFGGLKESIFSWNVAMRRHVVFGQGKFFGGDVDSMSGTKPSAGQTFKDGLSTVFGDVGAMAAMGAATWP